MRKVYIIIAILLFLVTAFLSFVFFSYGSLIKSFINAGPERINILVLGKGGAGHEAPDLTDTIIFISISNSKVSLLSLPRDIWVPEIRAKLNSAYYWSKQKNQGFELADESVSKIVGQPIDYNLVIDFSIFKEIIDTIGGIEVDVKNSFIDEKYPIKGKESDQCLPCRYETIKFEKGFQTMNGEAALKFVRSRNAEGDEGTDIAREARQQQVISAIQKKISSPQVYSKPGILISLWNIISGSTETDINKDSFGRIARKIFDARNSIQSLVLPEDYLVNPPITSRYDRQYVFVPRTGNWEEIQQWTTSLLE